MKLTSFFSAAILLCLHGIAFAGAPCDSSIPMIREVEALPEQQRLSLRNRIEDPAVDQSSIRLAREDAERSGLDAKYMYPVRLQGQPGYYLIFVNLRKDEMYYAYRVVPPLAKPVFKFPFYYMFMPEAPAAVADPTN